VISDVPPWLGATQAFLITAQGAWDCVVYSSTNGRFRNYYTKRVLRTLLLFVLGPLLVVPLLLRRAVLYFARRCTCCADPGRQRHLQRGGDFAGSSSDASSAESEQLTARSDDSFFPLSRSFSHPVRAVLALLLFFPPSCCSFLFWQIPDVGIAASLPAKASAGARVNTPVQATSMVDASVFVDSDSDQDDEQDKD